MCKYHCCGLAIKNIPKIIVFYKGVYSMHHLQVNLQIIEYCLSSTLSTLIVILQNLVGKAHESD